jgi:hypothetical protein
MIHRRLSIVLVAGSTLVLGGGAYAAALAVNDKPESQVVIPTTSTTEDHAVRADDAKPRKRVRDAREILHHAVVQVGRNTDQGDRNDAGEREETDLARDRPSAAAVLARHGGRDTRTG